MSHPNKHFRDQSSPGKSPDPKKAKLTEVQVKGQQKQNKPSNMDATSRPSDNNAKSARKSLNTMDTSEGCSVLSEGPPQWFVEFERRLDERLETLLAVKLEAITTSVKEHDERLEHVDFELHTLKSDFRKLKDEKEILLEKIDDLENRSRRNNLVLYGIAEPTRGHEDVNKTVKEIFDFVGVEANMLDSITRCHRTPTHKPHQDQLSQTQSKPRVIHIGFSTYNAREHVRKACLNKFKAAEYKGRKAFVSDDLSKRVLQQRKAKMEIFKRLKGEGKKPFFTYPAKLKYRENDAVVDVDLQKIFTGFK